MASIVLSEGIQILSGVEASRTSVIPDVGEPLWTTDTQRHFIGDNVTAGGIAVNPDSLVWIEWAGHGLGAALPASGIISVSSDGTTLTQAQATSALRPSGHVVRIAGDWLGFAVSGLVFLPACNLAAGEMYFLDPGTPNTLVDAASEPTYSVPVCHVVRKVGAGAWVRFIDWRAWDRSGDSGGAAAADPTVPYDSFRLFIETGNHVQFVILDELRLLDAGATDVVPTATLTESSSLTGQPVANVVAGTAGYWQDGGGVFPKFIEVRLPAAVAIATLEFTTETAAAVPLTFAWQYESAPGVYTDLNRWENQTQIVGNTTYTFPI